MDRLPRPLHALMEAPAAIAGLLAIAVMLIWAGSEGGFPLNTWYPGAIFLLALLAASLLVIPGRIAEIPKPVLTAAALLCAYTVWSYLSITWADSRGDAWDGANRTLLYLVVFVLFAAWAQNGTSAGIILGTWTLAIIVMATTILLRIPNVEDPLSFFIDNRLAEPAGYPNAAAATWLMAVWPAVMFASRREVPWPLRGVFAAGAIVLADVALLSQSRGALFALPIVVILFFVVGPDRPRLFAAFVPVAAGIALTVPGVLDIQERLRGDEAASAVLADVAQPIVIAAMVVAVLVAAVAWWESRVEIGPVTGRRIRRGVGGLAVATAVIVVVATLVAAGNPVDRARNGWNSFKSGPNVQTQAGGSRLTAGLGSQRYDYYRVGLDRFTDSPIRGVGADNFSQDYLLRGRSREAPRYPHSVQIRTLLQTGIIGGLLLLGFLLATVATAIRATRRAEPFSAAVAGGAFMVFLYWLVHGSGDWFFEFAGLGAPAFAMLGLACALMPRRAGDAGKDGDARPLVRGVPAIAGVALVTLAAGASLLMPWLAERAVLKAARTWSTDPQRAFDRLDGAARLNPLSERPRLIAGSIALRVADYPRAETSFTQALERSPRSAYSLLELGALASQQGRRKQAEEYLARAQRLSPRDRIIGRALARVRRGQRLQIAEINRQILTKAQRLIR